MRGETALLAGDAVPVHPSQEGDALAGPPFVRRSGSEKRRRSEHLAVRLTPEERAVVEEKAERAGLTTGSYVRQVLLESPAPRQVRRPPVERQLLAQLLGEFGKLGSNINQIARVLNGGGEFDEQELEAALAGLAEMRDAALVALGRDP